LSTDAKESRQASAIAKKLPAKESQILTPTN
jgi:hypothetical protein